MILVVASYRESNNGTQVADVHVLSGEKSIITTTIYCMPTVQLLYHLIPSAALQDRHYHSHFPVEKITVWTREVFNFCQNDNGRTVNTASLTVANIS